MEPFLEKIITRLSSETTLPERYPLRWLAIKLIENDSEVRRIARHQSLDAADGILADVDQWRAEFEDGYDQTPEIHIANRRYHAADTVAQTCLKLPVRGDHPSPVLLSDRIDRVVCHRFLGPVIFCRVVEKHPHRHT